MIRGLWNRLQRRMFTQSSALLVAPPPAAGEAITANNIETVPAIVRAINLIATDVARLPWEVVNRLPDGSLENQTGPTEALLQNFPSQALHSSAWRRHVVRTYLIYGNCICHIQKNGRGELLQLVPINPDLVQLEYDELSEPTYVVRGLSKTVRLAPDEVLHFRMPGGVDGLWGSGLLWTGREALSLLKVQGELNAAIAGEGVAPRCVIKHPGKLSEELAQAVKRKFQETFRRRSAGGVALMMDGMSVDKLDIATAPTDLTEAMGYSIAEVSRLTGVPVSMLADHSHSTYSNEAERRRGYLDTCLQAHLSGMSAEIRAKILPNTREIRWNTAELTKGTMADQVGAANTAVQAGLMTRNEARNLLGLNPLPGGDVITMMPGMSAEADTGEEAPDAEPAAA